MAFVDIDDTSFMSPPAGMEEPTVDTDKLCYEIFTILESKFLFGYDDSKLWVESQQPNKDVVTVTEDDGSPAMRNRRGKVCILSIDGGGMRSLVSGKMLSCLETALKNKSGNPEARISDYFDVAAGTGIGGIYAAMLFASSGDDRPLFDADDTWKFLAAEGRKFYREPRKRNFLKRIFRKKGGSGPAPAPSGLEKSMKEAFREAKTGRMLTLRDTIKPILIPCYDLSSAAPFLFSRADALESDSYDFSLWEVCLATSAEPGFSDPVCMKSVDGSTQCVGLDGGLAMNNPAAAAITHVLHNKQEFPFVRGMDDILVLSLGAGGQLMDGSFEYEQVRKWKAEEWARPLARISGDCSAELVDQAVAMAFGSSCGTNYLRIQANGCFGANADTDPSPGNMETLLGMADEMLKQKNVESILFGGKRSGEQSNLEKLEWFAEQLVKEHQKRRCRTAPTVALK